MSDRKRLFDTGQAWTNWSGNVTFNPRSVAKPESVSDLIEVVTNTDGTVRPMGLDRRETAL